MKVSQKPFGFFGISAYSTVFYLFLFEYMSQKPFGFFGISAAQGKVITVWHGKTVTKAFRLLWHFCPSDCGIGLRSDTRGSQKPFGFFGISARNMK